MVTMVYLVFHEYKFLILLFGIILAAGIWAVARRMYIIGECCYCGCCNRGCCCTCYDCVDSDEDILDSDSDSDRESHTRINQTKRLNQANLRLMNQLYQNRNYNTNYFCSSGQHRIHHSSVDRNSTYGLNALNTTDGIDDPQIQHGILNGVDDLDHNLHRPSIDNTEESGRLTPAEYPEPMWD
jgi:hypothetical protein